MDVELLGYLLNALDAEQAKAVELQLEESAELRQRLVSLRRLLQPLNHDAEVAVPTHLHLSTLRLVATHRCRDLPPVRPVLRFDRSRLAHTRGNWRRQDVLIAAGILIVLSLLIPSVILHVREQHFITACANNMRLMHQAFAQFQQDHDGFLPNVETVGKDKAVAGMYAPILRDSGFQDLRVACPSNVRRGNASTAMTLEEVLSRANNPADQDWARQVGGCYGYALGYLPENGPGDQLRAIDRSLGDNIPILSDRPPRQSDCPAEWCHKNSPNHGCRGQNVLFQGGAVRFIVNRQVDGNDIFLNNRREYAAGLGPKDYVLAPSETRPRPLVVREGE